MKKIITVVGSALVLAVAVAQPAYADPTYHYIGGCGLTAVNEQVTGLLTDRWTGVADVVVVATDHASGLPVQVTISAACYLRINGELTGAIAQGRSFAGAGKGFAQGQGTLSFSATASDFVELCEEVVVEGDAHPLTCFEVPIEPGAVRIAAVHHIEGL